MGADTVTLTSEGHAQKLQDEITQMRERHDLCDLTIQVSGGIEYAVHKVVLVTYSRYFRLQMDCGQLHGNTHVIPSVDSSMFAPLLTYLYTGQLHITSTNIWAIITAATHLDIPDALNLCENYLHSTIQPEPSEKDAEEMLTDPDDGSTVVAEEARSEVSCSSARCNESIVDENEDSLYKISPQPRQAGDSSDILKLKITKTKLSLAETPPEEEKGSVCFSDGVNTNNQQSDEEEYVWRSCEELKVQQESQKARKQVNPLLLRKVEGPRDTVKIKPQGNVLQWKLVSMRRDNVHQCRICGKLFAYRAMLSLHQKRHTPQKRFSRKVCRPSSKNFECLVRDHSVEYRCRLCHDLQKLWTLAYSHQYKSHAVQRWFPCTHCQQTCASSTLLHLHMVRYHGVPLYTPPSQLYQCNMCPRVFYYSSTFAKHIRMLHSPGAQCENCSRYIKPTHAREKHLVTCYRITTSTKYPQQMKDIQSENCTDEMRCSSCNRLFKYQKAYSKHMESCMVTNKLGSVEKWPYECRKCQDRFPSLKQLHEHCTTAHSKASFYKTPIRRSYTKRCTTWDCEVDYCDFKSSNPHLLTKHTKQHHPLYALPCNDCHFTTGSKMLLERHVRMRHVRALQCDACGQKFSVPAQLRVHMYNKHQIDDGSVQIYSCSMPGCRYTCVWKSSLKVHMQKHEIGKPYSCQICDKRFKREKGMQKHINKVHKGIRPYMCDICAQSYGEDAELKAHLVRHSQEKQYRCDHCQYATHDKGNYQSHLFGMHRILISNEMNIFTCNVCDFTTDRKHRYEMHMKNHMGIRDITCKTCGKCFVTKNTLANHIQRVHSEKTYTCSYCKYTTGNQHTFKEHVRVMHTHRNIKPYKCAYCDFRCHTSGNCRKHCANRHKGMEIKWVRLCELYPSGELQEEAERVYVTQPAMQPVAESNIKHISISRRISKDVLNQQQQMEQQQQLQQQQQQLQQLQHELQEQQQLEQRLQTASLMKSQTFMNNVVINNEVATHCAAHPLHPTSVTHVGGQPTHHQIAHLPVGIGECGGALDSVVQVCGFAQQSLLNFGFPQQQ